MKGKIKWLVGAVAIGALLLAGFAGTALAAPPKASPGPGQETPSGATTSKRVKGSAKSACGVLTALWAAE